MKIFISYSVENTNLIKEIIERLPRDFEIAWWDKDKVIGENSWKTIYSWIDNCDVVLAIITDNVIQRSMCVSHEITRAQNKNKKVIPIVGNSVNSKDLGFLSNLTYQRIDENNPTFAINEVNSQLEEMSDNKLKNGLLMASIIAITCVLLRD